MTDKYPNHLNDCKCLKSSRFTEDDNISLDRPQAAECLTVASPVRVSTAGNHSWLERTYTACPCDVVVTLPGALACT